MNKYDLDHFTVEDSKKWGLISLAIGIGIYFLSQRWVAVNKATLIALFCGTCVMLVRFYWRLRVALWFWSIILLILAADTTVVALFPTGKWSNTMVVLAPIPITGLIIEIFLISAVDSELQKRRSPD